MARRNKSKKSRKVRAAATVKAQQSKPARHSPGLRDAGWFPWVLLVFVSLLAYANAWPNELVFDDREFLAADRFDNLGLSDFIQFFSQSLWEAGANAAALYRPMFMVSLGIENLVFGDWYAGYHLAAILRHVAAVLLVFGFVREVFAATGHDRGRAQVAALLATLIFAVHPVLSDAVASVFNNSDVFVTLAIVGGLWYLLSNYRENPVKAWSVVGVLYFVGLLYKESAVSMPALAVVVIWLTSSDPWKKRMLHCLPAIALAIPLALYLGMRAEALEEHDSLAAHFSLVASAYAQGEPANASGDMSNSPPTAMQQLGLVFDPARTGAAAAMWFDALRQMVWPHPLATLHEPSDTPLWLALPAQMALLSLGLFAWFRKRPELLTGLLFFYLAILPASRIVGESTLQPQLMDRMLYLPSVGLVIALAAGFAWLARRFGPRQPAIAALVVVVAFIPVTWARNHVWADEIRLLEHDFAVTRNNGQLLYALIRAHAAEGNLARSLDLCRDKDEMVARHLTVLNECGKVFTQARRFEEAEAFYMRSLEIGRGHARTHFHLARLYVAMDRWQDARNHFEAAISRERVPFLREFMSGLMLMDLYPHDPARLAEARRHVKNALQLQPRAKVARDALAVLDRELR